MPRAGARAPDVLRFGVTPLHRFMEMLEGANGLLNRAFFTQAGIRFAQKR